MKPKSRPFPILGAIGAGLLALVIILLIVLAACTPDDEQPTQPTGIDVDIDRSKPRPPLKTEPKKPAKPAPRSKR